MKADIPQRCRGKLFSMCQLFSMTILMLLAAKLSNESAPNPQPNFFLDDSLRFFENISVKNKMLQKIPFIIIQPFEPVGTTWWILLRLVAIYALWEVSRALSVSIISQDRNYLRNKKSIKAAVLSDDEEQYTQSDQKTHDPWEEIIRFASAA